jgi:excisionase family DNA binding protein
METIYKIKEVAELLKLHRNTIFNMIQDGRIKANKIGNKYFINETELKRLRGGI